MTTRIKGIIEGAFLQKIKMDNFTYNNEAITDIVFDKNFYKITTNKDEYILSLNDLEEYTDITKLTEFIRNKNNTTDKEVF